MRRRVAAASLVAIASASALAGCGGGSGVGHTRTLETRIPSLGDMQALVRHAVDSELVRERASPRLISCVNRNLKAMSEREIAERVVESGPAEGPGETVPEAERLGPLGKGCR